MSRHVWLLDHVCEGAFFTEHTRTTTHKCSCGYEFCPRDQDEHKGDLTSQLCQLPHTQCSWATCPHGIHGVTRRSGELITLAEALLSCFVDDVSCDRPRSRTLRLDEILTIWDELFQHPSPAELHTWFSNNARAVRQLSAPLITFADRAVDRAKNGAFIIKHSPVISVTVTPFAPLFLCRVGRGCSRIAESCRMFHLRQSSFFRLPPFRTSELLPRGGKSNFLTELASGHVKDGSKWMTWKEWAKALSWAFTKPMTLPVPRDVGSFSEILTQVFDIGHFRLCGWQGGWHTAVFERCHFSRCYAMVARAVVADTSALLRRRRGIDGGGIVMDIGDVDEILAQYSDVDDVDNEDVEEIWEIRSSNEAFLNRDPPDICVQVIFTSHPWSPSYDLVPFEWAKHQTVSTVVGHALESADKENLGLKDWTSTTVESPSRFPSRRGLRGRTTLRITVDCEDGTTSHELWWNPLRTKTNCNWLVVRLGRIDWKNQIVDIDICADRTMHHLCSSYFLVGNLTAVLLVDANRVRQFARQNRRATYDFRAFSCIFVF